MNSNPYQPLIQETFVIRIWREAREQAWHGEILHLSDRASLRFNRLEQSLAFIRQYLPDAHLDGQSHEVSK